MRAPIRTAAALAASVAFFAAASASAQQAPCELHIWPAERMTSVTNKAKMASALDSPSQLDALQSLDLATMLDLEPGTVIVRHEEPLVRKTMNKIKTRRSDSKAACYRELIVGDVFYQKAAIYGRSLHTLFMVRDFGNDQTIDFEYKGLGGNGLKLFPAKEGEDVIAALDELVTVFKKNFVEYANNEHKSWVAKHPAAKR
jgi:hypothetical protein